MKNKILLSAILLFSFFTVKAQGTYAGFNVTYGVPVAGNVLGVISSENLNTNASSYENVKGSFGSGFTLGSYFGYMFNENIGFDIGVNYLWGSTYKFSYKTEYGNGYSNFVEDEVSASSFRISPAIRIGFGSGKIRPYLRSGITLGLFNNIVDNSTGTSINAFGSDLTEERFEMTRGNSIGFMGAFGANYSISESVFLSVEITNYLISWAPQEGLLVKSTRNGIDQLPTTDVADKEYEFVDQLDRDGTYDPNKPTVTLKTYFPMSSLGISIGMHFAF